MDVSRISVEITPEQLEYMIELATVDVALSMMTRSKLKTPALKDRLNARIDANRNFLNMLKVKKNELRLRDETTPQIPATRD